MVKPLTTCVWTRRRARAHRLLQITPCSLGCLSLAVRLKLRKQSTTALSQKTELILENGKLLNCTIKFASRPGAQANPSCNMPLKLSNHRLLSPAGGLHSKRRAVRPATHKKVARCHKEADPSIAVEAENPARLAPARKPRARSGCKGRNRAWPQLVGGMLGIARNW